MTSTSIKDVSTVMKTLTPNVGNTSGAKGDFQAVWDNQMGRQNASEAPEYEQQKVQRSNEPNRGEGLKAKESKLVDKKPAEPVEKVEYQELDEQQLEEAMEVLNAAAVGLMQEIADTFGMSMEELEQLMADMNLETLDVLNPMKLSALLLQAGNAADSLALLTDEGLCSNFQMLMNRQKELFSQLSETLQLSEAQLTQIVEEMSKFDLQAGDALNEMIDGVEEQLPQITVETEEKSEDADAVQKDMKVFSDETVAEAERNVVNKAQTETNTGNGRQEKTADDGNNQTPNLLLQNLKLDNLKPELQQVETQNTAWDMDTQNIMRQIMDYMKIQIKPDTTSIEMQLHPASLGTLQVQVASKGGVLTANFITQNEAVKVALESQMVQLKESFAEQGVKVEAIEVTVQTHQFESNLEQGRGRQQGETEKKNRPRRINLDASLGMDEIENLTEEEQLAADMMTANGSTVDYTA